MNDQNRIALEMKEREMVQDELSKSQSQLESILNYSPALIYAKDMEGRYLLVNEKWSEILDLDTKNVIGKTDLKIE